MKRKFLLLVFIYACFTANECRRYKKSGESSFNAEKSNFILQKRLHKLKEFSQKATKRLSTLTDYEQFYDNYLKHILKVRVPGTVGHRAVKEFIINTTKKLGWTVEEQPFQMQTPLGVKNFTNIIATLYPESDRVIAFAAHYDSKLLKPVNDKYFIAATDSAVPCAMLLDLAKVLADKASSNKYASKKVSPQLLFLDGEEAFVEWTKTDSIYGARYMAETLSRKPHHNHLLAAKQITELDSMDAFVLLDLLGAKFPKFYNFFGKTSHLYDSLLSIESRLREMGELSGCDNPLNCRFFTGEPGQGMYIEDDHIPFLRKDVPILHLIPVPFPSVWHKLEDDESAIDPTTVENLIKIIRHFGSAYVGLE